MSGLWLSDGFGLFIEMRGDTMLVNEVTSLSCLPGLRAVREPTSAPDAEVFRSDDGVIRISPGSSAQRKWVHLEGSVSAIGLHRVAKRPATCDRRVADTPEANYDVFVETFKENFATSAQRHVDWRTADSVFRPRISPTTSPTELFGVFRDMLAPLHDPHSSIEAPPLKLAFRGRRIGSDGLGPTDRPRVNEVIASRYVEGALRRYCNGQIEFGFLRSSERQLPDTVPGSHTNRHIGYLRINSFTRFTTDGDFQHELDTLESALDQMLRDAGHMSGLVIDVRINPGGSDAFGLMIASHLTARDYVAYTVAARDGTRDPSGFTPPQPIRVHASTQAKFLGPTVVLTSAHTVSAAETFVLALMQREPHITRIGAATQGAFSDILGRMLPNGWSFGLSNELYRTPSGRSFEGAGVPVDIEVQMFNPGDVSRGTDVGLDRAIQVLRGTRTGNE